MNDQKPPISQPVPVHIITGFLGAGKTTAILEILKSAGPGRRTAVMVNEWGEIALDGPVISAEHPGLELREITGGCICCSAGASLDAAIAEVLDRVRPDRIFIEPSGVAKPGDIVDLLQPQVKSGRLVIRPIICLVDPVRFVRTRAMEMPVYRDQVEAAQVLVANRCDLADAETIQVFREKAVSLFPPKTAVHTTRFGVLPAQAFQRPATETPAFFSGFFSSGKKSGRHQADADLHFSQTGWVWPPSTVFSGKKLNGFFQAAAQAQDTPFERAKSVFNTDQGWLLMELASGVFHQRPIQYRGMNRCQFIAAGKCRKALEKLRPAVESCRLTAPDSAHKPNGNHKV